MKTVIDTVKNVLGDTSDLLGEGFQSATDLLKETLTNFYDVKNLTKEKVATITNDLIALVPIIEQTGYRAKEINISVGLPPKIVFHFEKFADVSPEAIEAIIQAHQDQSLLKVIVHTLVSADAFQQKLTLGSFKFNEIAIEIGIPPIVNVKFMNASAI